MHTMGFEPMRVAPADLESAALDRSATCAKLESITCDVTFKYHHKLSFHDPISKVKKMLST